MVVVRKAHNGGKTYTPNNKTKKLTKLVYRLFKF